MASKALFSLLPCVRKHERKGSFLKNGSILLEDLIASCDGKSNPIRSYSAAELVRATNNFDTSCIVFMHYDGDYQIFRGILDDQTVMIKNYNNHRDKKNQASCAIRDIIISIQMSAHKNALKLLGCCLEFSIPALVLEKPAKGVLQGDGSLRADNEDESLLLPWKTRLRIARQLASALTYLHTSFPRPIVYRDLTADCFFLDHDYVPKLFDFSSSITIPPEQLYVEDDVRGKFGYLDPTYVVSGKISEKTDVYGFGVLLLVFLTGQKAVFMKQPEGDQYGNVVTYATSHALLDNFRTIVDPKILEEVGEGAQQQLHDFLTMAFVGANIFVSNHSTSRGKEDYLF